MDCDVVIVSSYAQADWRRKLAADADAAGLFARAVVTFDEWIADLWELHGDGRLLVGDVQRKTLMHVAAASVAGEGFAREVAPVAAECTRMAAGLPEFEGLVALARGGSVAGRLSGRDRDLVEAIARYEDALAGHGLVEPGSAALGLAGMSGRVFPRRLRVSMPGAAPPTWVQERFFAMCGELDLVGFGPAREPDGAGLPRGVEVRFAFPSGALAEPGLVADVVEGFDGPGSVVVTCKDPLDMFERLERRLGAGRRLCVQGRLPFGRTDFGRAFIACFRCVHGGSWSPAALSDVLMSPFSGLSRPAAVAFDERLRGDRTVSREEALQEIRAASEPFCQLEELAGGSGADALVGVFERRVQASAHRGDAWRAVQLAALGALGKALSAARLSGADMRTCVDALEQSAVPVSARSGNGGGEVLVTSQEVASEMRPRSCRAVVVADLTSEDYPVADRDDAVATFFSRIGLSAPEPALARARREFRSLLALPTREVVLMRPLGDANADETYPAAVLEELVDAYRADASGTDDIDNAYRLPGALREGIVERGEELLYANARASAAGCRQAAAGEVPWPALQDVGGAGASLVMPLRRDGRGGAPGRACPAPSQMELYLECPFRWFAERRLRIGTVDEGFGPLERGSFAHGVLHEFYRRFQASGHMKVNGANLGEARALMRETAEELERRQYGEEPGGGRYVAVTELERREVAALREQLVAFLDFEARLLPTYHPAYLEYELDDGHAAEYAGLPLTGKVDRIDVDGAGHAVIIDYKGSVNGEHEIAGKDWGHAGKVQTRVYARAVERALGLDVVGALYVSYGRRPSVSGAYDSRVVEAAHLPDVREGRCACGALDGVPDPKPDGYSLADLSFGRMLDETEAMCGAAIASMAAGEIAPAPAHGGVCEHCAVLACPKRGD